MEASDSSFITLISVAGGSLLTIAIGYFFKDKLIDRGTKIKKEDSEPLQEKISELKERIVILEGEIRVLLKKVENLQGEISTRDSKAYHQLEVKLDEMLHLETRMDKMFDRLIGRNLENSVTPEE